MRVTITGVDSFTGEQSTEKLEMGAWHPASLAMALTGRDHPNTRAVWKCTAWHEKAPMANHAVLVAGFVLESDGGTIFSGIAYGERNG